MEDAEEGQALAAVVAAIGTPGFGAAVMAALGAGAGADMCSAFALGPDGREVILAESVRPDRRAFAEIASLRYARRHWRRDREMLYNLGRAHRAVLLSRRSAHAVRDLDYRQECYGEGEVGERLSVCRAGTLGLILNAYRDMARGRFPAEAADRVARIGPVAIAALERHRALCRAGPGDEPEAVAARLRELAPALSPREAAVLALAARGATRRATAEALGLAETSVATYRRRGYAKLGLGSRAALAERLRAG